MELGLEPQSLWVDAIRHPAGLRVHVRGEETFDNVVSYWRAILRHLRLTRARNLLLLDSLEGQGLSGAEWRELLVHLDGMGLEDVRIARVRRDERNEIGHFELYARQAGYDARVFRDEREAEHWLLG